MNKGFDTRYRNQGRSSRGESSTRLSAQFLLWRLRERAKYAELREQEQIESDMGQAMKLNSKPIRY